jgi:hypothetical protein
MSDTKTIRGMTLTAVLASFLVSSIATAASDYGPGTRRGPPPEAFESCVHQTEGEACSFSGGRGEDVTGTCTVPPKGEESLVCAPEGRPPKGHGEKPEDE